jgi:hypothetical protein
VPSVLKVAHHPWQILDPDVDFGRLCPPFQQKEEFKVNSMYYFCWICGAECLHIKCHFQLGNIPAAKGKRVQGGENLDWITCFSCMQWLRKEDKGQLKSWLPVSMSVLQFYTVAQFDQWIQTHKELNGHLM